MDSSKKKLEVTYQPSSVDTDAQRYVIETKTGAEIGGGTDAQVRISLLGAKQNVITLGLDTSNVAKYTRNIFEAGDLDKFVIYDYSIGKVKKINITKKK